ncbi:hypothetical protein E2C01_067395 [Portunus trituberculatus]|uniref:Uncharacterized protein n=1 Tax=Portunus trituberculatus TaxID=210409 RepID=A0A5B7HUX3_PORTR|nr:hypothetical protein [Portunus trituberculatus]
MINRLPKSVSPVNNVAVLLLECFESSGGEMQKCFRNVLVSGQGEAAWDDSSDGARDTQTPKPHRVT